MPGKEADQEKWLKRRLPVRVRRGQTPWVRLEDTEHACLQKNKIMDQAHFVSGTGSGAAAGMGSD